MPAMYRLLHMHTPPEDTAIVKDLHRTFPYGKGREDFGRGQQEKLKRMLRSVDLIIFYNDFIDHWKNQGWSLCRSVQT